MSNDNKPEIFVHPSSVIDNGAEIGAGTKIWHFCHVSSRVQIGTNVVLGQGCFVAPEVRIGNGVRVQNGVSIYTGVIIEDDVFCGPHMVFTNVINPRSFIERKDEFRQTVVRKGASIGAGAIIVCGNEIGQYAFVGAGALVTKDVKDFSLVYGSPARHRGWVGKEGNRLDFDANGRASDGKATYELIDQHVRLVSG